MVPVGPDQTQHLEFAIEIAQKLNNQCDQPVFTVPEPVIADSKVKSLHDPTAKMSKSDPLESCIFMDDDPNAIRAKIARAKSDTQSGIVFDEANRPGISALISLLSLVMETPIENIVNQFRDEVYYSKFKLVLAEAIIARFDPIRRTQMDLLRDPEVIELVLAKGAAQARELAAKNYLGVRDVLIH